MAGGRQGVAAGGALRQGGGAHARSSRVCAPVPPPPPSITARCGAVRCSAFLCSALHCPAPITAPCCSPSPVTAPRCLFSIATRPPPPSRFQWLQGAAPQFPPGRCLALALLQIRALLPSHSVAPSNHCNAFKRSSTPFLPPGTAPQDPSEHCPTCQAPHCLTAPLTPLHCTALHLPPAETAPNLAVTAAATLHHASLLASGCTPTATPQCTASPFDCCTTQPPSTARNSL